MKKPPRPALPTDKVRFVGDPVACVVAETLLQAKDAAEAVEVDIEPLPAVTDPEEAARAGRAAALRRGARTMSRSISTTATARRSKAAFATRRACDQAQDRQQPPGRQRDGAARGDRQLRSGNGRFTLYTCCQGVFGMKSQHRARAQCRAQAGARAHRQCRRLVRHEGRASIPNMSASCMRRARSAAR